MLDGTTVVDETGIKDWYAGKTRELVRGSYRLELGEIRCLNLLMSKVDGYGEYDSNTIYTISVEEFMEVCGMDRRLARRMMEASIEHLAKTGLRWETLGNVETTYWFQWTNFDKKTGEISIQWTDRVLKTLTGLKDNFYMKLVNKKSMVLKSSYSIRVFELLSFYRPLIKGTRRTQSKFKISTETLINLLDVPESARQFKKFNDRILSPAILDIKKKGLADVEVSFEKRGRRIVAIEFMVQWHE